MDLIHVPGKRNRKVPILMTPDVRSAMKVLSDTRTVCGVPHENKYFFATDSSCGHFHSWLVLNRVAVSAQCENPHLITSTRLRKYVATLAQVHGIYVTVCPLSVTHRMFSVLYDSNSFITVVHCSHAAVVMNSSFCRVTDFCE